MLLCLEPDADMDLLVSPSTGNWEQRVDLMNSQWRVEHNLQTKSVEMKQRLIAILFNSNQANFIQKSTFYPEQSDDVVTQGNDVPDRSCCRL